MKDSVVTMLLGLMMKDDLFCSIDRGRLEFIVEKSKYNSYKNSGIIIFIFYN